MRTTPEVKPIFPINKSDIGNVLTIVALAPVLVAFEGVHLAKDKTVSVAQKVVELATEGLDNIQGGPAGWY